MPSTRSLDVLPRLPLGYPMAGGRGSMYDSTFTQAAGGSRVFHATTLTSQSSDASSEASCDSSARIFPTHTSGYAAGRLPRSSTGMSSSLYAAANGDYQTALLAYEGGVPARQQIPRRTDYAVDPLAGLKQLHHTSAGTRPRLDAAGTITSSGSGGGDSGGHGGRGGLSLWSCRRSSGVSCGTVELPQELTHSLSASDEEDAADSAFVVLPEALLSGGTSSPPRRLSVTSAAAAQLAAGTRAHALYRCNVAIGGVPPLAKLDPDKVRPTKLYRP